MPTAWLFNPENDIALGQPSANFTPPKMAQSLHRAGALLPLWLAEDTDVLLAPDAPTEWVKGVAQGLFGIKASAASRLESYPIDRLQPWGWSAHALRQFSAAGASKALIAKYLPNIERLRQLSHRRTGAELMRMLNGSIPYPLPPIPQEVSDLEQFTSVIDQFGGDVFVKAPWSSTGRGVMDSTSMKADELNRRSLGIMRRQGTVMVEKALRKEVDFAMLFHCTEGRCSFCGYSLFFNEGEAYGGNLMASDDRIAAYLSTQVGEEALRTTKKAVEAALTKIIGSSYCGWIGVDMMVYMADDGSKLINPCVEVNLRMTMGVVAWLLRRKLLDPDTEAVMRVKYEKSDQASERLIKQTPVPLVVHDKRLKGGTLDLVPPSEGFSITIEVAASQI